MPLYEYRCDACGERFEVIRKFSDAPLETCRQCGKGPIQRLQSSPAIQFKGSGFYITDYAKKGSSESSSSSGGKEGKDSKESSGGTKETKSDKGESSSSGSSESAKSETKSETKSESAPAKTEAKPTTKDS